jgi:hypothetical protein
MGIMAGSTRQFSVAFGKTFAQYHAGPLAGDSKVFRVEIIFNKNRPEFSLVVPWTKIRP